MKVTNIGTRGWSVDGKLIAPTETVELDDALYNDIKDNVELEIVKSKVKKAEAGKTGEGEAE